MSRFLSFFHLSQRPSRFLLLPPQLQVSSVCFSFHFIYRSSWFSFHFASLTGHVHFLPFTSFVLVIYSPFAKAIVHHRLISATSTSGCLVCFFFTLSEEHFSFPSFDLCCRSFPFSLFHIRLPPRLVINVSLFIRFFFCTVVFFSALFHITLVSFCSKPLTTSGKYDRYPQDSHQHRSYHATC